MSLLEHATAYAKRGWMVLPLKPREKTPLTAHGLKDASNNENIIARWWDRWPDANIGIATGPESGIWILDVDGEEGDRSFGALEAELGRLPRTLDQATGGGGRQYFFSFAPTRPVRNKQGLRPGIDVRGDGGYVVVPPSIHPSGRAYEWSDGGKGDMPVLAAPSPWLDLVAPPKRTVAPWERLDPAPKAPAAPPPMPTSVTQAPVIERARRYLAECEPAVQGRGGHNALLWAARAMVVGFELDDSTAVGLLWSDFNPRCSPPWDRGKTADARDFERKVAEARRTPGEKPAGWLLDECGLRDSTERLAQIGRESAAHLLAAQPLPPENPSDATPQIERLPFPLEHFPGLMADYCRQVAMAHVVDESFACLPALAVAGAAMGNTWRLELKLGFVVPPLLWVGVIASSGANKSGPLDEVMRPLRAMVSPEDIPEGTELLNPQARSVVSDATLEAMLARLNENPRGLLIFRDELAGWVKGFNAYKKGGGGGDEQAWLEFWGAKEYQLDRKTNNEQIRIPAAACSVLGGIQPSIFADCMDPSRFASGLVPRILIACPPATDMYWSETTVDPRATEVWKRAIIWLRTRPFAAFDPDTGRFAAHTLTLTDEGKAAYVAFFNLISAEMAAMSSEHCRSVASKARVMAGRLALIHHGLSCASSNPDRDGKIANRVGLASVEAGIAWARWCLAEQMRVYGFSSQALGSKNNDYLVDCIKTKSTDGKTACVRDLCRWNVRRWTTAAKAKESMRQLVESGLAQWSGEKKEHEVVLL